MTNETRRQGTGLINHATLPNSKAFYQLLQALVTEYASEAMVLRSRVTVLRKAFVLPGKSILLPYRVTHFGPRIGSNVQQYLFDCYKDLLVMATKGSSHEFGSTDYVAQNVSKAHGATCPCAFIGDCGWDRILRLKKMCPLFAAEF